MTVFYSRGKALVHNRPPIPLDPHSEANAGLGGAPVNFFCESLFLGLLADNPRTSNVRREYLSAMQVL